MTKCTLERYSLTGMTQNHEGLCILPLNIINEKIYIVLWFWFVALACVSAYLLLTKLVMVLSATYRKWLLRLTLPGSIHKGLGPRVSAWVLCGFIEVISGSSVGRALAFKSAEPGFESREPAVDSKASDNKLGRG